MLKMREKRKIKKMAFVIIPILILFYISSAYFIKEVFYYNSNNSFIKYVVFAAIAVTALIVLIATIKAVKTIYHNKSKKYVSFIIVCMLLIGIQTFASYNMNKISKSLSKMTNKYSTYSTSLVSLKKSNVSIKDAKIGIINNENDIEGYIISQDIIDEKNISKENLYMYDTYEELIDALYEKKVDMIFISSSYENMFSTDDKYYDINDKVKKVTSKSMEVKKKISKTKTLTKPFTVLIMGVDSETESLSKSASFNGDTLMLITFNPNTLNATILSIPRDTYVPIMCNKNHAKNKINSSSYGGTECVINTVENLTDINIDYWVKINFRGVVSLVDAIGGIEVDIPYAFCEQDSKRRFGKYTIYIEKGKQTLNGEQTLAFARNRHPWPAICGKKYSKYNSNDFIRGQNQQLIMNAILNKLKSVNSLSKIYSLLDVAGNNIDTNIDKNTMMTGFDTFERVISRSKNITSEDFVGTQRLYLSGYDAYINNLYYFKYYDQSLNEISNTMKINLEIEKPEMDKSFDYSINKPYENKQIGKGVYKY